MRSYSGMPETKNPFKVFVIGEWTLHHVSCDATRFSSLTEKEDNALERSVMVMHIPEAGLCCPNR